MTWNCYHGQWTEHVADGKRCYCGREDPRRKVEENVNTYLADKLVKEARKRGPEIGTWKRVGPNEALLEKSVEYFIEGLGEDLERSDLKDTPKRVVKMWKEIYGGYFQDPKDYVTDFDNENGYTGPVILRNAELHSTCAHHFQPFFGHVDIAYQPGDKIIGLSKLVRIARVYAKRLQVQERLTKEIADALDELLEPDWVVVRYEAEHYCMKLRGVRIHDSSTVTIYGHGAYPKDIFNT